MAAPKIQYDPEFTERVIRTTGPNANKRLAEVMPSLIRHLHDFAREVNLTVDEWMAGVLLVNEAGRMSDEKRNEGQLVCDVLGLESLVDEITSKLLSTSHAVDTPSAILGPFYRDDPPELKNDQSIVFHIPKGCSWEKQAEEEYTYMWGKVISAKTGKPIKGAIVDVWHTAPNGLYEQQDPEQQEYNFRGRFRTDEQGRYSFYCLRPVSYPVPHDGPAGKILELLDRQPFRPAHTHMFIRAEGHKSLVTQVFDGRDPHIEDDAVFAVKDELIVDFKPVEGRKEKFHLEYDITLGGKDN
ncbi:putative catechol dioxygenase [Zalerion maritima]|uniref:Catechol dioxygenase n=1 Tax=Zalerion maritima TaxID=339359 RepID=A0AAD5RZ63_9PEZI|nr:putative catechol dioxygenase [Zalerion maritima]